jgi:hypothetical protein
LNSCATPVEIGSTVEDPDTVIVPFTPPAAALGSVDAALVGSVDEAVLGALDAAVLGALDAAVLGALDAAVLGAVLAAVAEPVAAPPPVLHALMAKTAVRASAPRRVGLVIVTRWSSQDAAPMSGAVRTNLPVCPGQRRGAP